MGKLIFLKTLIIFLNLTIISCSDKNDISQLIGLKCSLSEKTKKIEKNIGFEEHGITLETFDINKNCDIIINYNFPKIDEEYSYHKNWQVIKWRKDKKVFNKIILNNEYYKLFKNNEKKIVDKILSNQNLYWSGFFDGNSLINNDTLLFSNNKFDFYAIDKTKNILYCFSSW